MSNLYTGEMDTKPFDDLQLDPRNPRKMSDTKAFSLRQTMDKFGDLSCIVFNRRNGKLVGGHMRKQTLEKMGGNNRVVYTTKFDTPDAQGTVALGYVWHDNTPYAYREVDWSEDWHLEANQAANNNLGDWDWDLLPQINQELLELGGDLAMTGWDDQEMNKILGSAGTSLQPEGDDESASAREDDGLQRFNVKFTDEQYAVVFQAIGMMKHDRQLTNEINGDLDANALYYICKSYVENATSQNIEPAQPDNLPAIADDPAAVPSDQLDSIPTV